MSLKMFVTISLLAVLVILCVVRRKTEKNYWEARGVTFEKPLPIVGNALNILLLRRSCSDVFKQFYFAAENAYYGIWILNKPQLIIKCPNLIRQIFVKDFNYFHDRHLTCDETADDFSANMMFFMKNPKWKVLRTKTTPIFSCKYVRAIYIPTQTVAKDMITFINGIVNEKSVDVYDICQRYITQSAYSIAFGIDPQGYRSGSSRFISISRNIFTITWINYLSILLHYCKSSLVNIFKIRLIESSVAIFLKQFFLTVAAERRLLNNHRGDLVDFLIKLKDENNLKDNEIAGQVAQFLIAGYETTSSAIALALYELSLNKLIQQKLREEICAFLDADGDIPYDSLSDMDYLDKLVHETLRKYPVMPILGRTCVKDYKIPHSAVVIEKGVEVIISLSGLHHDPKYYPTPEVFDPDRFSNDNIRKRHPYTYLPFGQGQRNCIGQRVGLLLMKLGVVHIIKNFEIDICQRTRIPLEFDPRKMHLFVQGGIYIQFTKIDHTNI